MLGLRGKRLRWFPLAALVIVVTLVVSGAAVARSGHSAPAAARTQTAHAASATAAKGPFRLGLVLTDLTVSTIDQIYVGAKQRAGQVGNVNVVEGGSSDTPAWLNACDSIIHSHINALAYSTLDEKGTRSCIVQANAMGLPIICVLPCTPIGKHNVTISIDFKNDGKMIGNWMATTLHGKGDVAILVGAPGDEAAAALVKGFKAGLASKCPACKVVAEAPGGFNGEQAYNSALAVLASHPDLSGIYSLNDDGALGALRAIQQDGKLNKIALAGHNGSCQALKNILTSGGLGFTVLLDGQPLGEATVDIALKLAKGQKVNGEVDVNAVPIDHATAIGYLSGKIKNPSGVDVRSLLKQVQSKGCN